MTRWNWFESSERMCVWLFSLVRNTVSFSIFCVWHRKSTYHITRNRKWTDKEQQLHKKLWKKHKSALQWFVQQSKQATIGSLSSLMVLSILPTPALAAVPVVSTSVQPTVDKTTFLITDLYGKLPKDVVPLSTDQEERITAILSTRFHVAVKAELQGKRLNRNYGLIGEEQHLARFPGDTMQNHFADQDDAQKYWSSGMDPGLGAWGYFATSSVEMLRRISARKLEGFYFFKCCI